MIKLDTLPDEVLVSVLQRVLVKDDEEFDWTNDTGVGSHRYLIQVSQVSKNLHRISKHKSLWQTVILRCTNKTQMDFFSNRSARNRNYFIQHLSICARSCDYFDLAECAQFDKLDLSWIDDTLIFKLHVWCPNIRSLEIEGVTYLANLFEFHGPAEYVQLKSPEISFSKLTKLVIKDACNLEEVNLYCPVLKDLKLTACFQLSNISFLRHCRIQLNSVDFCGVNLDSLTLESLLQQSELRNLTTLGLGCDREAFTSKHQYTEARRAHASSDSGSNSSDDEDDRSNEEFTLDARMLQLIGNLVQLQVLVLRDQLEICIWDVAPVFVNCRQLMDLTLSGCSPLNEKPWGHTSNVAYVRKSNEIRQTNPHIPTGIDRRHEYALFYKACFGDERHVQFPSFLNLRGNGLDCELMKGLLGYLPNVMDVFYDDFE